MSSGRKSGASLTNSTSPGHPKGWCTATVGDTGDYINGFAFKPSHRQSDGRPIVRIQNLTDSDKPLNRTALAVPAAYHVATGEMLVSWSATVDVFVWNREPALVNQHIFRVVPDEQLVDKIFLFHWLKVAIDQLLDSEHLHGSTMKHINRGPFMAHEIPLPPRSEQERIAEKLEELLSELDAGVAELKAAQRKLVQYRQSLLKAAVEGALTADWRAARAQTGEPQETGAELLQRILTERRARWEASQLARFAEQGKTPPKDWHAKYKEPVAPDTTDLPTLPQGWVWVTVDHLLVDGPQNGLYLAASHYGRGFPILRIDDFQNDWIRSAEKLKLVEADEETSFTYALHEGDLVVNRVNSIPHLGKSHIVRREHDGILFESNMMRARLSCLIDAMFVGLYLSSEIGRARLIKDAKWAVNQASINQQDVKRTPIPLPGFSEQLEICEQSVAQLQEMASMQSATDVSLKQAAAQRKNILKAAFAGQLVPQDPNDEPASVLLERIRAERATGGASASKRGRKAKEST